MPKPLTIAEPAPTPLRPAPIWPYLQFLVWVVGIGILAALLFWPLIGLHAFWNVLIPVAPALLVFAPGLWRNICPLASVTLLPRRLGLSQRRELSIQAQHRLAWTGVALLFLMVPLRHVVMDLNGPSTALAIAALAVAGVLLGLRYEWKSGWCSGSCPIHPVEKLYGTAPAWTPANAHCTACERCVATCSDSAEALVPHASSPTMPASAATLLVGGFAGFVWGWFHVPDYAGTEGWAHLGEAYGWPLGGAACTLLLYALLLRKAEGARRESLDRTFAAAAIACYYWYRLPALFGFPLFLGDPPPANGVLVDLSDSLPGWFPLATRAATTILFVTWLVGRSGAPRPWTLRPAFAQPS